VGKLIRGNTAARACQAASPGGRGLPIRLRDHRASPDLVAKCRPAPGPTIRPEVSTSLLLHGNAYTWSVRLLTPTTALWALSLRDFGLGVP
jgi:hypothetical protein